MVETERQLEFRIVPLDSAHDREAFACGEEPLNKYLRTQASQDLKKRVAAVYVLTPDNKTIAGYYTLSQFAVNLGELPGEVSRKLPRYPQLPATLLGRLARSLDFKRQGIGELLLMDALRRSLEASKTIASFAVIVDAKDDQAIAFYGKYGFIALAGIKNRMFLPMASIQKLPFE